MPALAIPADLDDIVPDWLTAVLRAAGATEAPITAFAVQPLGAEAGFLCQTVQLSLIYGEGGRPGPASVVAKLPSADPRVRTIIHSFGFYEREAKFYARFSEANPLRPPASYFAAHDETTKDTCILLEDISADLLDSGDDLTLPPALALEFAQRLGAFHALHWERSPEGLEWLVPFAAQQPDTVGIGGRWQRLLERNPQAIPDAFHPQAEAFIRHAGDFAQRLSQTPRTIVHGDLRVDNVLVARNGLRVLDWQTVAWGRGALDLGFFLTQCFTPKQRRALEPDVLPAYHHALVDGGVAGYSLDECWDDYRLGHLRVATMFVQEGSSLDMSGARSQVLLAKSLERSTAAMIDLKPFDLLR
jgi:hypothetical protein